MISLQPQLVSFYRHQVDDGLLSFNVDFGWNIHSWHQNYLYLTEHLVKLQQPSFFRDHHFFNVIYIITLSIDIMY